MIWQHHSRLRWFCTDIQPLTIEVKAFKRGGAAWRVKSDAGTFFQGKADHPMTAMTIGIKHAEEIAKRYAKPAKDLTKSEITQQFCEDNGLEYKDIKMPNDINPEDITGFPDSPSTSDH
jgi:hypothetical protein